MEDTALTKAITDLTIELKKANDIREQQIRLEQMKARPGDVLKYRSTPMGRVTG